MIGLKARSTLVPAEEWLREFIPYGTPCDDPPCDEQGGPRRDCIEKLEAEITSMREEMALMKAMLATREAPPPAQPATQQTPPGATE